MDLIPWRNKRKDLNPAEPAPLTQLRQEMERVFDNFRREPFGWFEQPFRSWGGWNPTVDLLESDRDVTVRAELPGVEAKDLDIAVSGTTLTISGEKRETIEKKEGDLHHTESRFGSFRRAVTLPEGVDMDRVEADFANGVLTIRLAKSDAAAPRKIEIKTT